MMQPVGNNSQYYAGGDYYAGEAAPPKLSVSRSRSGEILAKLSRSRSGEVMPKLSRSHSGEVTIKPNGSESYEDDEGETINKDRWDEGGRSDCGYPDIVHDTLMSLGQWMHGIVGEPTEEMENQMRGIGSYFQEASYAVRDYRRGTLEKGEFKFKTDDIENEEGISDGEEED